MKHRYKNSMPQERTTIVCNNPKCGTLTTNTEWKEAIMEQYKANNNSFYSFELNNQNLGIYIYIYIY